MTNTEHEAVSSKMNAIELLSKNLSIGNLSTLSVEILQEMTRLAETDETVDPELMTDLLAVLDAKTLQERMSSYIEALGTVDRVCIVITCCDSRVSLPSHEIKVPMESGKVQSLLTIPLPTIGSGALSRQRLEKAIETLRKYCVSLDKITIVVTQHGNAAEIEHAADAAVPHPERCSCGLREILRSVATVITPQFRQQFQEWVQNTKRHVAKNTKGLNPEEKGAQINRGLTWAPDRAPMEELENNHEPMMRIISEIARQLGFSRRLVLRILHRNANSDIIANEQATYSAVTAALKDKFPNEWPLISVVPAYYDHNEKSITFSGTADTFLPGSTIELPKVSPEIRERKLPYQDPDYSVILFGKHVLSIPPEVLLTHLAKGTANISDANASNWATDQFFTSDASDTTEAFLCALAEQSYAVSHRFPAGGRRHDDNFKSLKALHVVVDDEEHAEIVRNIRKHPEYKSDFAKTFAPVRYLYLHVVNVDANGLPGKVTVEKVEL